MRSKRGWKITLMGVGTMALGLLFVVCPSGHVANGQEEVTAAARLDTMPEGAGLAAKYPGDEGLERDPRVLFVEDFETGDIREIGARWGDARLPENMQLVADIPANSPGRRSLHISQNGHFFTHTRGVDTMFARFYVKFPLKTGYPSHLTILAADRTPTPWPKGGAGSKPPGDQSFCTNIEPWGQWGKVPPPGVWHMYSYWHEMKPDGLGHYWGNYFDADQEPVEPGRWYCVEAMLKANSAPEAADGEQAFWIDGQLVGRFQGIRWRTSDKLKINTFWLEYYVGSGRKTQDGQEDRVYEIWYDDVVVATEYIGPVQGKPQGGKKVAAPGKSALLTPGLLLPPPGQVVFSENFEKGVGKFGGGESVGDGVDGSKALAVPPAGVDLWNAFSTPVQDSTTIRFKLKPLADVPSAQVLIWSEKHKDNGRYHLYGLKQGEWTEVEFRAIEVRMGWAMDGPSLEGDVLSNFKLLFEGDGGARILLDDFEVRE